METSKPMFPAALKAGGYLAIIGIVLFIIQYVAGIEMVGIWKPILLMLLNFGIIITVLVFLLKSYRTSTGGLISFGQAFLFCFIAFFASSIISTIFTYVFNNYFDPGYMKHMLEAQKDYMENYLSGKVSDTQLQETLNKIDKQAADANSIFATIKNMGIGLIFGAVASLIIGAIMKKNPSVFDNSAPGGVI
ncbi:MAG: DUF4199 domain-containing protein [Bacteroidetes bacterium]|nr:DUF4199 domain-containing protein [Bacteroidota bacterium]